MNSKSLAPDENQWDNLAGTQRDYWLEIQGGGESKRGRSVVALVRNRPSGYGMTADGFRR